MPIISTEQQENEEINPILGEILIAIGKDQLTQEQIANKILKSQTAVSRNLIKLISKGYIEKTGYKDKAGLYKVNFTQIISYMLTALDEEANKREMFLKETKTYAKSAVHEMYLEHYAPLKKLQNQKYRDALLRNELIEELLKQGITELQRNIPFNEKQEVTFTDEHLNTIEGMIYGLINVFAFDTILQKHIQDTGDANEELFIQICACFMLKPYSHFIYTHKWYADAP